MKLLVEEWLEMSRFSGVLIVFLFVFCLLFVPSFGEEFNKDIYRVSQLLRVILDNYIKMDFEKILPLSEGKAKKDFQRIMFEIQDPQRYETIRREISLLRDPTIKEVKIYENDNLALAVVEWNYKRSVPRGNDVETVNVKRETSYLFKKFGGEWKIISYR